MQLGKYIVGCKLDAPPSSPTCSQLHISTSLAPVSGILVSLGRFSFCFSFLFRLLVVETPQTLPGLPLTLELALAPAALVSVLGLRVFVEHAVLGLLNLALGMQVEREEVASILPF